MNDIRYHVRRIILLPNGRGSCPRHRFPRTPGGTRISPGWTATGRSGTGGLAGPGPRARRAPEQEEYEDFAPLTAEELAEISEAAADELLAVKAATTGRRGPGQPGSARVFPGESSSPAAAFGPGMALDVLPGCAQLAVAAEAAAEDGFAGVSEAELVGVMCGWDRIEAHAAARKLAAIAELARRNPGPLDEEFTADQLACALGESRARADELIGMARHLDTHLPGTGAALDDGTAEPGQGPDHRQRHRPAGPGRGPRRRGRRCWTGRPG